MQKMMFGTYRHCRSSLTAELEKLGRKEWFDAEMQTITSTTVFAINGRNAWQRMNALQQMAGDSSLRQKHWQAGAKAWLSHATNQEAGYWQTRCWLE